MSDKAKQREEKKLTDRDHSGKFTTQVDKGKVRDKLGELLENNPPGFHQENSGKSENIRSSTGGTSNPLPSGINYQSSSTRTLKLGELLEKTPYNRDKGSSTKGTSLPSLPSGINKKEGD